MEIILCKDVEKLGKIGDVVKVREGFARNFLFPRKLAFLATAGNLKKIEMQKMKRAAIEEEEKNKARELAEKLNKVSVTVTVEVNDLEKLYGSVSDADIVKALEVEGYKIDKKSIELEKPITELGIYEVAIRLHHEVTAKIRLWVAKK